MHNTVRFVDDNEEEHNLPGKKAICSRCDGNGTHTNPAIDGNGITAEMWEHEWDDEERGAYLRGAYDVQCQMCKGRGIVVEVDHTAAQATMPDIYAAWCQSERERAEYAASVRAEREFGA